MNTETFLRDFFPSSRILTCEDNNLILATSFAKILICESPQDEETLNIDVLAHTIVDEGVDGGLFFSQKNVTINGYSRLFFGYHSGKPILCLSAIEEHPYLLQIGVLLLENILRTTSSSKDEVEEFNNKSYYFHREKANLSRDKEIVKALQKQISKREKSLDHLLKLSGSSNEVIEEAPELRSHHKKQATVPKEELVLWLRQNGSWKTTSKDITQALNLGSYRSITNAGGIQLLKQEAFGCSEEEEGEYIQTIDVSQQEDSPQVTMIEDPELDELLAC